MLIINRVDAVSLYTAHTPEPECAECERDHDASIGEGIANTRVSGDFLQKSRFSNEDGWLVNRALLDDPTVRVDDTADSGVGRPYEVATFLDRSHGRLFKVLVWSRRATKPRVVGNRGQQFAAVADKLPDQVGIH